MFSFSLARSLDRSIEQVVLASLVDGSQGPREVLTAKAAAASMLHHQKPLASFISARLNKNQSIWTFLLRFCVCSLISHHASHTHTRTHAHTLTHRERGRERECERNTYARTHTHTHTHTHTQRERQTERERERDIPTYSLLTTLSFKTNANVTLAGSPAGLPPSSFKIASLEMLATLHKARDMQARHDAHEGEGATAFHEDCPLSAAVGDYVWRLKTATRTHRKSHQL